MNRVDLVGRLTRDPELRHTTSGRAVCQIKLRILYSFFDIKNYFIINFR